MSSKPKLVATIGQNSNTRTVRIERRKPILNFDSKEIRFFGPIRDKELRAELLVTNPSKERIVYIAQTNAAKRYYVDPSRGLVEPESQLKIIINLIPTFFDDEYQPVFSGTDKLRIKSLMVAKHLNNVKDPNRCWSETASEFRPGELMETVFPFILDDPTLANNSGEEMCDDDSEDTSFHECDNQKENDTKSIETNQDNNNNNNARNMSYSEDLLELRQMMFLVSEQVGDRIKTDLMKECRHNVNVAKEIFTNRMKVQNDLLLTKMENQNNTRMTRIIIYNNLMIVCLFVVYVLIDQWFGRDSWVL